MCDSVNLLKSPWVGRSWALKENCSVVLSYEYNVKLSYKYLRLYSQISDAVREDYCWPDKLLFAVGDI